MAQPQQVYLDRLLIYSSEITVSADLRYLFIDTLQTLFEQTNYTLIAPPKLTLDPETFLNSIKKHPKVYHASLSRQFAADFAPDIEQTTLKDEPKEWYIKTADFEDTHDRPLQHRSGEYTQLLEDLATYHQILQNHCDRIIVLRSHNYGGYDVLINAAMQCLGYTTAQFQFIVVQPLKLYAFHQPSQKLHSIPDLHPNELLKAIDIETLRWNCFRTPLTEVAPINLSNVGQSADSLYQLKAMYVQCCQLLEKARQQGVIPLEHQQDGVGIGQVELSAWSEESWGSPVVEQLVNQVQAIPDILSRCAEVVSLDLLVSHLEAIRHSCDQWFKTIAMTPQSCVLLLAIQNSISKILGEIFGISVLPVLCNS